MRRGAVLPGLIVVAIGVVLLRLRRARTQRVPAPVTSPALAPALRPVSPEAAPVASPDPAAARFLSVPWRLVAPPGDAAELEIAFARNEHERLNRVDVQETPSHVFVTVIVQWKLHTAGSFAAETEETATVALAQPLGERELVHGATDVDDRSGRPLYP